MMKRSSFHVLLFTQSSSGKNFMLLDQTLVDDAFDAVGKILLPVFASQTFSKQLRHIADVKSIDDRYTDMISWLLPLEASDWYLRSSASLP